MRGDFKVREDFKVSKGLVVVMYMLTKVEPLCHLVLRPSYHHKLHIYQMQQQGQDVLLLR